MKFGFTHRLMTDALAVLGLLALLTSGKLHLVATILLSISSVVALALPDRLRQSGSVKLLGVILPVAFLLLQVVRLLLGQDPIPVIVEFAAGLQVVRLATRRGALHDHQVILLALLHLIAGTVLGGGLAYAFSLLGFLVFTPGALVLSHLRREVEGNYKQGAKDRTGSPVDVPRILRSRRVIGRGFLLFTCLLSLPVFLMTSVVFVAFPRVGLSWMNLAPVQPARVVGFSDRVDLGKVGKIRSDPTLVMRVAPKKLQDEPQARLNFYLRGGSFDTYDEGVWSKSIIEKNGLRTIAEYVVLDTLPPHGAEPIYSIHLESIQPQIVFLPERTTAIAFEAIQKGSRRILPKGYLGTFGEISYQVDTGGAIDYDVFVKRSAAAWVDEPSAEEREAYLQIPLTLSPKIETLAQKWAQLPNELSVARAVEDYLRKNFVYDLNSDAGAAKDPLENFLFESKRGHCEFYSTAMVMLLRHNGIPARNVTGFVGGSYNQFGEFYAIRQGDAHSWVEAYLPGRGWTRFDPTPTSSARPLAQGEGFFALLRDMAEAAGKSWDQNVVGFDLQRQVSMVRAVRRATQEVKAKTRGGLGSASSRLPYLFVALLLIFAGVYFARKSRPAQRKREHEVSIRRSLEVYAFLERTLSKLGHARPAYLPPLGHALQLASEGRACAPTALKVTERYLEARYGDTPFTEEERQQLLAEVRSLLS